MNDLNRAALEREQTEPAETPRGLPLLVAVLLGGIGAWGSTYFWYEAGAGEDYLLGDGRMAMVDSLNRADGPNEVVATASEETAVDGAVVYAGICQACHQSTGKGLAGVFPPLAGSEWVVGPVERPVALVLRGLAGPIEVDGVTYNNVMPAFGEQLSDPEIAAVVSYIRKSWGNDADPVDATRVKALRARWEGSGAVQGGAELSKIPDDG
ncbi:MAG: c-type cytochrome [Myxococcota bacterium]